MSDHNHSAGPGHASDRFRTSSRSGHEDIDRVRQAAEALFAPKRPITDAPTSESTGSTPHARKPRILSAAPERPEQPPVIQAAQGEPIKRPLQRRPRTPCKRVRATHLARLRTWLEYGMTVRQAADVYGVSVDEIERIIQRA
jgi:hypothetical protein